MYFSDPRYGDQRLKEQEIDCVYYIQPNGDIIRAVEDKIISTEDSLLAPKFYFSPKVSSEKINAALRSSFHNRLDRIYPCCDFESRITLLHQMGHIGPLWDLVLRTGKRR